jgi:hypothetical protein
MLVEIFDRKYNENSYISIAFESVYSGKMQQRNCSQTSSFLYICNSSDIFFEHGDVISTEIIKHVFSPQGALNIVHRFCFIENCSDPNLGKVFLGKSHKTLLQAQFFI